MDSYKPRKKLPPRSYGRIWGDGEDICAHQPTPIFPNDRDKITPQRIALIEGKLDRLVEYVHEIKETVDMLKDVIGVI